MDNRSTQPCSEETEVFISNPARLAASLQATPACMRSLIPRIRFGKLRLSPGAVRAENRTQARPTDGSDLVKQNINCKSGVTGWAAVTVAATGALTSIVAGTGLRMQPCL